MVVTEDGLELGNWEKNMVDEWVVLEGKGL